MGFVGSAARGLGTLVVAVLGFVIGSIGWAAASGVIGGVLDSVGIVIGASTYLAISPLIGLAAAGYAVSEVSG